jgi:diguanylate cyclase (GGDEF)-like protein
VALAVASGLQQLRRLTISGRNNEKLAVDIHLVPVVSRDGTAHGAAVLIRDASRTITLEERVQSLHEKATRDPLTQVANRAEFDRVHTLFLETHLQSQASCALIICDIDHFKKVNDTYGHQAGDAALISFGNILRSACRAGDLVARYGGEEFAMLCADCDNVTATTRAEEIRRSVEQLPQPALNGNCFTVSFGVTEMQGGDTPETMLRRADRALYQAKEGGRNRVVQLGSGLRGVEAPVKRRSWFSWFTEGESDQSLERDLFTPVPLAMTAEKLRGFVADKHAQIESIDANHVVMQLTEDAVPMLRRRSDRPVPFIIDLQFEEQEMQGDEKRRGFTRVTMIRVTIRPRRQRDRRSQDVQERARHLLSALKSYLMAQEMGEGMVTKPVGT